MQVHKEYNTNNNIHSSSLLYNFTLYNNYRLSGSLPDS